ncbi:MAG TPA: type II CAAX endopeptidase family protein [Bacillota bacterium]|nr:type II CAAX endopeptidase family protein [Bacillota bacterium]
MNKSLGNTQTSSRPGSLKASPSAWMAGALLLIPIVLTFCLTMLVSKSNNWALFYLGYMLVCLITLAVLVLILKQRGLTFKDIGFNEFKASYLGWGLLFFGIAGVWCTGVALILKYGFGLTKDWLLNIRFSQPYHPLIMLLAVVVIGPVTEESVFRGFFLTVMRQKWSLWLAGLVSAVLFGLYYYFLTGLTGALLIFFWSPLPIILFLRHKSIYPGIVLHMVNNLFPYVIIKLLSEVAVVQKLTEIGVL